MTAVVGQLIVGPDRHGVTEYARRVQSALETHPLVEPGARGVDGVHVHFTDRLFGSTATDAADEFCSMTTTFEVGVSVTLHDLPQESDGKNFLVRSDAYRRVAATASGVIVSSEHERALLADIGVDAATVVPLAVTLPSPVPAFTRATILSVALLGYLYPGKGHEDVLRGMEVLDPTVGLLAIGKPSDGHDDLVDSLGDLARTMGRRFAVTGYAEAEDLPELLRSVAVPIAHHRHMSASASITTWIEAGRRPLVPRTRYTTEIAARSPGTITLFDDTVDGLVSALTTALAEPRTTWIDQTATAHPTWPEVAAGYRKAFEEWFG